jgi:hypothetical protein
MIVNLLRNYVTLEVLPHANISFMPDQYQLALEQATKELREVNADVQRLLTRRATLENLVKTLTSLNSPALTKEPSASQGSLLPPYISGQPVIPMNTDGPTFLAKQYLWKQIAILMRDVAAFTSNQAADAVEKYRGASLGHTRLQQIRNSMTRHDDIFRQNGDGTWTVIGEVTES